MKTTQRFFFTLTFVLPFFCFSQNEFLDFVIDQNNDTIYGTIRNMISKSSVLYEKNSNSEKDRIKFRIHKLKKYKKIRFNDEIYTYVKPSIEDGIYAEKDSILIPKDSISKTIGDFINIQKRLSDFIITNANDTIYGRINASTFGKLRLIDSVNKKVKIEKEEIKIFRFNNEILELKEKIIVVPPFFRKDDAYLKLVLDGKLKLYEFDYYYNRELNINNSLSENRNSERHIFIEKDNELIRINNLLHKKKLVEIFSENQILVSKILNKEYIIDNIYLMVKFYNENK